jgi:hypothetical protein
MSRQPDHQRSRREFLRGLARGAAGAALAGGAAALVARGQVLPPQECANQGLCRRCPVYDGCGLPQALSARREGMRP